MSDGRLLSPPPGHRRVFVRARGRHEGVTTHHSPAPAPCCGQGHRGGGAGSGGRKGRIGGLRGGCCPPHPCFSPPETRPRRRVFVWRDQWSRGRRSEQRFVIRNQFREVAARGVQNVPATRRDHVPAAAAAAEVFAPGEVAGQRREAGVGSTATGGGGGGGWRGCRPVGRGI
jgi:hypothetical protein